MNNLRIGILLSSLGFVRGGLETIAVNLAGQLALRGHDVRVVTGMWPGRRLAPELTGLPIRWQTAPCLPMNLSGWSRWSSRLRPGLALKAQSLSFVQACRLHPAIRRWLGELDVTLSFLEVETVLFAAWRRGMGLPHVSYFAGGIDWNWLQRDCSTLRVGISQTVVTAYRARGLHIDGIVSPGLADEWLQASPSSHVRQDHARTLFFTGRLESNKGVAELLTMFAILTAERADLQLRLAGDGPLRAWVVAEIARRGLTGKVICLGALPPDRLRRELAAADLFVFPSHYESWGIAVVEALAAGIPVICSDLPALREATAGAALFAPAGEIDAWVQNIARLLDDQAERKKMAEVGQARAAQLTWAQSAAQMEEYLRRACAARS